MNNKQVLRHLPFHNNDIDASFEKPRIKKDVIIKPKAKIIQSTTKKKKIQKK